MILTSQLYLLKKKKKNFTIISRLHIWNPAFIHRLLVLEIWTFLTYESFHYVEWIVSQCQRKEWIISLQILNRFTYFWKMFLLIFFKWIISYIHKVFVNWLTFVSFNFFTKYFITSLSHTVMERLSRLSDWSAHNISWSSVFTVEG